MNVIRQRDMGHEQQEFICQKLKSLAPDILCYKTTWAGLAPRLEPSSAVMLLVVPHVSRIIHVSAVTWPHVPLLLTGYHTHVPLTDSSVNVASALRRLARPH